MKFKEFSEFLIKLDRTSSRLEITAILAELFKKVDPAEIDKAAYLLLGSIAPRYKGVVFNIADRHMVSVLSMAYGVDRQFVQKEYKNVGDLGDAAQKLIINNPQFTKRHDDLSIVEVFEGLTKIANDGGEGSVERKISDTADLLKKLDPTSAKYVIRILLGKLRLGFSDLTLMDALSWMEKGDKTGKSAIEKAYQVLPDIGVLAKNIKEKGIEKGSRDIKPIVGIPVAPMLAQRIKSPAEMIKKMGEVAVEPKFDGVRVLIHFKKGAFVKAFTRNLNEVSYMFPELAQMGEHVNAKELILDSEAVGMDEDQKAMVDFQTTMQRRRKHDIAEHAQKIPLRFQVFDVLYVDGKSMMGETYVARRRELAEIVKDRKLLCVDEFIKTTDPTVIISEYEKKLKEGLEGVLVKKIDSHYIPGRTGWRWVKMKEVESATGKLPDTLDCIVMGYTSGKGKRTSFGLGQFIVGIRDGEEIKTVTKVGTGLTDEQFVELKKRLANLQVKDMPKEYRVHKLLEPDFWVEPDLVVELAGDDITKSPTHTAGYALRFPRLVKFRDDKSYRDATTLTEVKKLFELQKK